MALSNIGMLPNILFNSMLNEVIRLILNNPMHEVAKQITLTLSVLLELPPLLALQYGLLIQAQIVDAEFLQVMGVVSMCDHQDREDVAAVDELFYVF